jgi:hypothetical protein
MAQAVTKIKLGGSGATELVKVLYRARHSNWASLKIFMGELRDRKFAELVI